ncbi:MAG: ATP-binding protein [Holophagaceae bacterium]|nr:ATP-binding protein [Holophagaceae bacterium]
MERFKRVIRSIQGRKELLDAWGLDPALVGKAQGVCLFHGPSGTGKSLAGEVLAKELGLPLWRMQASELESAYVGESEARLHKLFELAKGKPAVLLLDEADSVLADRSRAEGSTRRYIQSLTAAWLRELDRFSGVLVLTSNFADSMDAAFERRIQFRIEFPVPDAGVREKIWAKLLGDAPIPGRDSLDLALVADRFPMAGGLIRNAFLTACHRAAELGHITQEVLHQAAEEEQKSALPKVGHGMKRIHGFAAGGSGSMKSNSHLESGRHE